MTNLINHMATQLSNLTMSIHPGATTVGMLLALAATLTAAPPTPISSAELEDFNQLAAPMSKQINHHQQRAQKSVDKDLRLTSSADASMRTFLVSIGQDTLLAQNNATTPAPSTNQTTPLLSASAVSPPITKKPAAKKAKTNTIKVECDGGFYFDGDEGVIAYLKNIRLTDSDSRFKLRCSDELKVYLEKQSKEPKKVTDSKHPGKQPGDKEAKASKVKDRSFAEFGKLKHIIASGNVKVTGKDNKGQPFIASGNTLSYNALTGEMILKDGLPILQQSSNQYFQAQEPGQWIRIQMKDKRIHSIITSNGKWTMQAATKQKTP